MRDLEGRVAVVTGAASGIGRALAARFAGEGMRVVLADIDGAAVRELGETLRPAAVAQVTDVSDEESVHALADRAYEAFGAVHLLCNNAGVAARGGQPVWETAAADWDWVLGVNLLGVVHGIRAFVPRMLAQGGDAHIVNTASLAGLVSFAGGGAYGASKHAVVTLSEQLALELHELGPSIGVSVLCPGLVRTPMTAQLGFEGGIDPEVVAGHVVEAIREERFWVLTHPEWTDLVRVRCTGIIEGTAPQAPAPSP